ncbi:Ethylene-responsive transcription factor-like protein [Thalictrum thalictroides]|uniref:Ethylene-responsive transcription factor-like protein n=1 Tax=Thalictrum thalictroides TaxID=46969 RepID=A0A7J6W3G1_THATH|nr:Ethylene-responsive transcription factor-like protein [Thalictrum thalictroides]
MVSLRRRRLLGYCSGIISSEVELPTDVGNDTKKPIQLINPMSVHPVPSVDLNQPKENDISIVPPGSSNVSGTSSSKEETSQKFSVAEQAVKRRKRHRRKHFENQEPCIMRGVYYKNMKWQAAIKVDKKQIHLGTVGSQVEAAHLYDRAAFMCGREPNFELSEEEKQELRQYDWNGFLTMTRHAITNKKHQKRLKAGPTNLHETPLQSGKWEKEQGTQSVSDLEDVEPETSFLKSKLENKKPDRQGGGSSLHTGAPGLISRSDGNSNNIVFDRQFEERLQAIRRSAIDQKKIEESNQYGTIDYDAPIVSERNAIGLGTQIGAGIAVVVLGLVFAFGDFLPSTSSNDGATVVENKPTEGEKLILKSRLEQYEKKLSLSPEDPAALEAAAVTLSELGDYDRAASLLEKLSKEKPSDPDVYRLLGEVKYELKDYEGSAAAYKNAASAVQVLLASREYLNLGESNNDNDANGNSEVKMQDIDPIQVDLLLGKAYSDWGHVSDAVSVYDRLISLHPDDFRGYLAKGIILKENGKLGDAERMFIQARFFAPDKAKALVDRYSKK